MATVAEYQAALRERRAAHEEWDVLRGRLGATASLMERGAPLAFKMGPVESDRPQLRLAFRASEWPTADQISALAQRVHDAREAVKTRWASLSDEDRIGLLPPDQERP